MISHIHHINFLVADLDLAVSRYQHILGLGAPEFDHLASRAVKTARFRLGQTWLILVQPLDESSIPAQHLKQHGEGFFLLSLATDDLDLELDAILSAGGRVDKTAIRQGLDGWRVADLDPRDFHQAQLQLTEEAQ